MSWNQNVSTTHSMLNNSVFSEGKNVCTGNFPDIFLLIFLSWFSHSLAFWTETLSMASWSKLLVSHPPVPNNVSSENFWIQHHTCVHAVYTCGFFSTSLFAPTKSEKPQSSLGTCDRCSVRAFSALFADLSPPHRWERESEECRMPWASLMCRN